MELNNDKCDSVDVEKRYLDITKTVDYHFEELTNALQEILRELRGCPKDKRDLTHFLPKLYTCLFHSAFVFDLVAGIKDNVGWTSISDFSYLCHGHEIRASSPRALYEDEAQSFRFNVLTLKRMIMLLIHKCFESSHPKSKIYYWPKDERTQEDYPEIALLSDAHSISEQLFKSIIEKEIVVEWSNFDKEYET